MTFSTSSSSASMLSSSFTSLVVIVVLMCSGRGDAAPLASPRHTWVQRTSMPYEGSDMTATLHAHRIYLVGGCSKNQSWAPDAYGPGEGGYVCEEVTAAASSYSPLSDTWTPLPAAPRPRYRHAAAAVAGSLYVFGGRDLSDTIVPQIDVLDTSTSTWTTASAGMPSAVSDLTAYVLNGIIYTVGGYDASYNAQTAVSAYDPASRTWTARPSLVAARGDVGSAVVDGVAYVFGGFTHVNNFAAPLASLERTSTAAGDWTTVSEPASVARGDKAVAALHGRMLVLGGETKTSDGHSQPLNDIEAYDPTATAGPASWTKLSELLLPRFRFAAAAYGDSVFVFGGQKWLVGTQNGVGSYHPVTSSVTEYHEHTFFDVSRDQEDDARMADALARIAALEAQLSAHSNNDDDHHDEGDDHHGDEDHHDDESTAVAALLVGCVGVLAGVTATVVACSKGSASKVHQGSTVTMQSP